MTAPAPDRDFTRVQSSPIHGQGLFARRDIPKGTRLMAYEGRRLPKLQILEESARGERSLTYVLNLDEGLAIDGAEGGNDARFANHGCDPNCEVYTFDGVPYLYAMQDIPAGTELTFDYRLQSMLSERLTAAESRRQYPCHCGAPDCRGTMVVLPRRRRAGKSRAQEAP